MIASTWYAADGRLNAQHQSVFYGSTSLRGAVIEVANHKGPQVDLWAGEFTPTKALYHLDVMEPPACPSPFAPGAADTFDAIKLLIRFAETLREPKPKELGRHYLPTQIFIAYLLAKHQTLRLDAIKYASSLDPQSENWVVYADNEHCADADSEGLSPDEIYLLLDPNAVTIVSARLRRTQARGADNRVNQPGSSCPQRRNGATGRVGLFPHELFGVSPSSGWQPSGNLREIYVGP